MSLLEVLQARAREALWSGTEWLTAEEIMQRAPADARVSADDLAHWESEGRIFGLDKRGRKVYPLYAFDTEFRPRSVIKEVLQALCSPSPSAAATFFESTSRYLAGRRARDLVASSPDLVVAQARAKRDWEEFGG